MVQFYKPKNLKYTDMCIWIDENAYRNDLTEDEKCKIFEYLYHIMVMLAWKARYFKRHDMYNDYGIYAATKLYYRLINPKQFDETRAKKMPVVKSILNYAKRTAYGMKCDFEKESYVQSRVPKGDSYINYAQTFHNSIQQSVGELCSVEVGMYLEEIPATLRMYLKQIPYAGKPAEWNDIYLSCLLTFLNRITLSNENKAKLQSFADEDKIKSDTYDKMLQEEKEDSVILFHLDKSMKGYIEILVEKMLSVLASDISSIMNDYMPSEALIHNMCLASGEGIDNE